MEQQPHQYEVPQVVEVLPEWRKPKLRLAHLVEMQSLPDNVFLLRQPEQQPPAAA